MERPIYLDYNATTPVDPSVLESMLPYLREDFGNPSSTEHAYGWQASQAVEKARVACAQLLGAEARTIVFTSGATEANNLALFGVMRLALSQNKSTEAKNNRPHLITTAVEHKAVLDVAHQAEKEGAEVTYLPVDADGRVSADQVRKALRPTTRLVSVMFGQNEIGSINPIGEIGAILPDDVIFHVDAAQAAGRVPIDVNALNIDLLSVSGHKLYAPKGVGFLYVRQNIELLPLQFGGGQEHGVRPGTLNVPGVVGLGVACDICQREMTSETERLRLLRDQFIDRVLNAIPTAHLNGHRRERLVSNISFSFSELSADAFAFSLSGLAVSAGSACSQGAPSHVLAAIGLPTARARATIRFGIGRFTKENDLNVALAKILEMVRESAARQQN